MLALRMKKAVRKGATLVVADPRKIWLTKLAKRHLQLRPGTDVWLVNAMMHTILAEGLKGVKERHGPQSVGVLASARLTMEENFLIQKLARTALQTNSVHSCEAT